MATNRNMTLKQIYAEAGLTYIRYDGVIETKPNGQKKIGGPRPKFSKIEKQIEYKKGDGKHYSLLMGREIKEGRWVVLLDFDNKEDENTKSGLELAKKLKMDDYEAPKQFTPSGGLHYLFTANASQKDNIKSPTGVMFQGEKYAMDVKFNNSLCNCQPSKIEDYGKYQWEDAYQLLEIPELPDELYELIRTKAPAYLESPRSLASASTAATLTGSEYSEPATASTEEVADMRALCACLSLQQLDDYATWIRVGMVLKKVGAPMALWEEVSRRSRKFKNGDCARRWSSLKPRCFTMRSLEALAKAGNMEMYERVKPAMQLRTADIFDDSDYHPVKIDTPFLVSQEEGGEMTGEQQKFKELTEEVMDGGEGGKKTLVVRSRYGSGKTTFLQRLVKKYDPKRVLFVSYRQTLARDLMRNFGKLGFKNYLDSQEDPEVWNSPRLIVQMDSLMHVLYKNDKFISEDAFDLRYDMIILDESESLLAHMDEKTMEKKEIEIFSFFNQLLEHSGKLLFMDGDISGRTLSFAKSYGDMTYINNINTGAKKVFNLILDEARWERGLHEDLQKFYAEDPNFKVVVVCQGSNNAMCLMSDLREKFPHLVVESLVGTDSGETKKRYMEHINETLSKVNVFLYSPVIESGVDITIKVKKVYGTLCGRSNCQRAFLQMLARCRNVEDHRMDIQNDICLKLNQNYNFWQFHEVLELNKHTVQTDFVVHGHDLTVSESEQNRRRKTISVWNTAETLNKHSSVFINYLKMLLAAKGITFQIDANDEEDGDEEQPKKKAKKKNYKLSAMLEAKDLTADEYEEIAMRKKQGKTTTAENYQAEKYYWKRFLLVQELDETVVKEFMFNNQLLDNFVSLVDTNNHFREDNLRSAKLVEMVKVVRALLFGLGWASPVDDATMDREAFATNFVCNVCCDPALQNKKRINELFDLKKTSGIHENMTTQQILMWVNALLKPFSIRVKAINKNGEGYKLEVLNDVLGIITRRNKRDRFYEDEANLLKQEARDGDPFIDEATGKTLIVRREEERVEKRRRVAEALDTSKLDVGINFDD